MHWGDVASKGTTYSLAHLHPFTTAVEVGSRSIDLHVTFGFHVFTDEKENGAQLDFRGERRFFCPIRCRDSHQAAHFVRHQMATAHVRPFISKSKGQMFYVVDIPDYAIFMTLQKPKDTTNELKCHVVTAYTVDRWGKGGLPTWAKLRTMGFVLDKREQGEPIPLK